ncbi:MAG TPA: hypothetical protein VFH83_01885, partial [Spirochaetia bacterium]|nr:hypothetical protein [Spirochaetia bacterium]
MTDDLSREAQARIEKMVERVARKAGYSGRGTMTYRELLQVKLEQKRRKLQGKVDRYRRKLSLKPSNTDFAEEIRAYLADGVIDLVKEGRSEDEAMEITLKKFDDAELRGSFDDFAKALGGFGMEEWMKESIKEWTVTNGDAIGLFYAAFTVLGMTLGTLLGYLLGRAWQTTAIGLAAGLLFG